jgi:hypothetical protein
MRLIPIFILSVFPVCLSAFAVRAQELAAEHGPTVATSGLDQLMVPIHTAPDDPRGGAYGTWAVGPEYKVSFHDGFRFYPVLGPAAPKNLPFGWRTESVVVAGKPLFDPRTEPTAVRASDFRFEYRYPGVVEAYDVRKDGVEQTFTILARPATIGDIIVTGRIETELVPRGGRQGLDGDESRDEAIEFVDAAGVSRVRYGRAWAIDARGSKTNVVRRIEDGRIQLVLAGDWLREAVFPVTIDPLTSATQIGYSSSNNFLGLDFAAANADPTRVLVFTRTSAANDLDTFGVRVDSSLLTMAAIWGDATASWSSEKPKVAVFVDATYIVCQRKLIVKQGPSYVSVLYHHPNIDDDINSGFTRGMILSKGYTQRNPDVCAIFQSAVVSWQEDYSQTDANTLTTRVCALRYDANTNVVGPKYTIGDSSSDVENAAQSRGAIPMIIYQKRSSGFGNWQVFARNFNDAGFGTEIHVSAAHVLSNCQTPQVSGPLVDFACAYIVASGLAQSLVTARFNFPSGVVTAGHTLETMSFFTPLILDDVQGLGPLWTVLYRKGSGTTARIQVRRIGWTGATTESKTLFYGQGQAACVGPVLAGGGGQGSPVIYVTSAQPNRIFARWFLRPAAGASEIGKACPGELGTPFGVPFAGVGPFALEARSIPVGTPCILWLAGAQGSQPLPGGCTLHLDPATTTMVQTFSFANSGPYGHLLYVDLPDSPIFIGNLYYQVTWPDPQNAGVTLATNAIELLVR